MKKRLIFPMMLILIALTACSLSGAEELTPTSTPPPPVEKPGPDANVLFVRAVEQDNRTWTFTVTVDHPDTGWEDYANGWDVVLPDGTVVRPDPAEEFTRLLLHPHENEQPFTRSQSGIVIPEGVTRVTVRAHDLVDGFGGQEVIVHLDEASGLNFEVERLEGSSGVLPLGVTYQRPDGNRLAAGFIDLLNSEPVDIQLNGVPVWVVGVPDDLGNPVWVAALDDGQLQGFAMVNGAFETIELSADSLPPGAPPAVTYVAGDVKILNADAPDLAEFTHPILTPSGHLAYINGVGEVVIQGGDFITAKNIDALKDGRLLSDGNGSLVVLSAPSDIYQHGVLGDQVEAKAVALLTESGIVVDRLPVFSESVIEGIAPIWIDVDGDADRDIILTLSNRRGGAQIVIFSQTGDVIAQGEPIGTGNRWRHQIAVAPFGPDGELELVDVLTPHIGGVVEFFRLEGEKLVRVAEISGFTSHVIGSRNLDMAFAGDLDADGRIELALPRQDLNSLGILERTIDGVVVVGEVPLEGGLSSNLATVTLPDGGLGVAAGLGSGILRVWLP